MKLESSAVVPADYLAEQWEGPLGVVLMERDLPLTSQERGTWMGRSGHVAAGFAVVVRDEQGQKWRVADSRYFYNPEYGPTDDVELARDVLECVALDYFAYDNEYWPESDDPEEVAACVLAYVRDMGAEIPSTEDGVREMVRQHREPGLIYRRAVRRCGRSLSPSGEFTGVDSNIVTALLYRIASEIAPSPG